MRRRRRSSQGTVSWLCSIVVALGARSGQGQSAFRGSVDAGVATLEQPSLSRVTAPTLSADLRSDGRRFALRAAGGAALAASDRWSAQGELGASWIRRLGARAALELGGAATALRYHGAPGAATGVLLARQHLELGGAGVWVGASGGAVGGERGRTAPTGAVETGGWVRGERLRASLSVALQRAQLDTIDLGTGAAGRGGPPLVALDATAQGEWRTPRLELGATAIARRARRQSSDLLWSTYLTSALTLAPRVALTASAGDLAADPIRGFPARRVATLGLRWRLGASAARRAAAVPLPAADVVVRGGRRLLRVRAGAATHVEVRGDFTRWQPVALSRAGEAWELPVALDAGTVHLALRLDGGAWRPPANLPSVEDEFGERSALLVIP